MRTALIISMIAVAISAQAKPNVILCMTDDQGWGDVGYNGHPHLKTPHLDQMSREGITFNRFYSAAAMCSPTRGSVYTGRNPYRFGITFAMKGMLEPDEITITSALKKNGYTTGHFGKWHLGTLSKKKGDQKRWGAFSSNPGRYYCPPWERDVDISFVTESKVPTWDPLLDPGPIKKNAKASGPTGKPYGNEFFTGPDQKVTENMEGDASRVIMDRALPFIEGAVNKKQPFLAVIWFHTPHSPVVGGENHRAMYKDHPEHTQHYYACLTAMDEQMGRLRKKLSELGVADDTMVWFCSDNGPARQGSPRHVGTANDLSGYKLSIKEGGIRVPGVMVWPKVVKKPRKVDAPCVTSDYFPTVLDAIGIELPTDRAYDGISLMPLLRGERDDRGSSIGFLNKNGAEAAWTGDRYKLLSSKKGDQLFDLTKDPGEKTDLSKQLPEVTAKLKTELTTWKTAVMKELSEVPK
jgi:arylsulfatase A-like enzyme